MKILISGASGLIGTALKSYLKTCGHQVITLTRNPKQECSDCIFWKPENNEINLAELEGIDAVINLAGENIAGGRWTEARKQKILDSRLQSTATLANAIAKLDRPPATFISASAIGVYGDRGDFICNEETPPGKGFLASVCKQWEAATQTAEVKGIRTVHLRFGIVLSNKGGALAKMLPPFKLGLGGAFGTGEQYMSWISIDDLTAIILFALMQKSLHGAVNAVTPNPVTNYTFTKTLGNILSRPTFCRVPAFVLNLLLGKEMAHEFLLSSTRVVPLQLKQAGYTFLHPELSQALKHLLK